MYGAKAKEQTGMLNANTDAINENNSTDAKLQDAMDQASKSCDNYNIISLPAHKEIVDRQPPGKTSVKVNMSF